MALPFTPMAATSFWTATSAPSRIRQRWKRDLSGTVGVVETGLFIGMATTALVATPGGIIRLDRPSLKSLPED